MSKTATILAVRAMDLPPATGFVPIPEDFNPQVWAGPRQVLEDEVMFRQILPYIIVKMKGGYLTYERGASGGEGRLHGKVSIGWGGHTDAKDATFNDEGQVDFWNTVRYSAVREVHEETGILVEDVAHFDTVGLIISDDPEVDRVHLAIVLLLDLSDTEKEFTYEDCIKNVQTLTKDQLMNLEEGVELESWSQKALSALD